MQEEFLTVVAEHRDRGATVFLSSHDLTEVERSCDRVGIIRDGRLAAIEEVGEMKGRAYRKVMLTLGEEAAATDFASIPGVDALSVDGPTVRFRVLGDLNPVVDAIARHDVRDLEVTAPSLEELFLQYYDGEAEQ
jgi:ABC-2 type transport system ATP-binding protein